MLVLLQDKIDTRWGHYGFFATSSFACAPLSGRSIATV